MDDKEWFVERCLVLEVIIKNAIHENYEPKEKAAVFANMLKEQVELCENPERAREHFSRFISGL